MVSRFSSPGPRPIPCPQTADKVYLAKRKQAVSLILERCLPTEMQDVRLVLLEISTNIAEFRGGRTKSHVDVLLLYSDDLHIE